MKTLSGKVAVVTGAGRGIGAACARALAVQGASVILAARTRRELEVVAATIRKTGGAARVIPCDVSRPASVKALARKAGRVDILVNAAGVAPSDPLLKIRLADWERTLAVNAVCPGFVDTEMTQTSLARICAKTGMSRRQALDFLKAQSPQKRLMEPEEVAWLVVSLCAPQAGGINGQALVLDGGQVMV